MGVREERDMTMDYHIDHTGGGPLFVNVQCSEHGVLATLAFVTKTTTVALAEPVLLSSTVVGNTATFTFRHKSKYGSAQATVTLLAHEDGLIQLLDFLSQRILAGPNAGKSRVKTIDFDPLDAPPVVLSFRDEKLAALFQL